MKNTMLKLMETEARRDRAYNLRDVAAERGHDELAKRLDDLATRCELRLSRLNLTPGAYLDLGDSDV